MTDITLPGSIVPDDLTSVAIDVLAALLGLDLWEDPADLSEFGLVAASLDIIGAGNPRVVIGAETGLARQVAHGFFGGDDAADPAVWPEAIGELCNVIAGSLKPLLQPASAVLGLPTPAAWPEAGGLRAHVRCAVGGFGVVVDVETLSGRA